MTGRLTRAIARLRDGTADPAIMWNMMDALMTAYGDHELPTGPDTPGLLEELRSLCGAASAERAPDGRTAAGHHYAPAASSDAPDM